MGGKYWSFFFRSLLFCFFVSFWCFFLSPLWVIVLTRRCRFVSPKIAKQFDLDLPQYDGIDQIVEVDQNGQKL